MAGYIIGNQSPKAGETNYYEINDWTNLLSGFGMNDDHFLWYIHMKKNGSWKDITTTPKKGKKVPYTFGEALIGTEVMLKVYEVKKGILPEITPSQTLIGELKVIPTSSKTPKIEKVVLFNRGAKDVNKASYMDTLIAQAHCVAMFNQEVEFYLWEDDAPGGGHNAEINKNNRFNRAYKARVNEKGIAEASIPLSANQNILKEIANKYMMKGDKSEGANHEYYVTASYSGKIQGASQVNVDVANPDDKKSQPQPKPKNGTPKFPAKPGGKKQADPQGNILEAVFINNEGKELSQMVMGGQLRIRIHSKNMVGKAVQYVIWEHDTNLLGVESHDEIFRSGRIKLDADVFDTAPVTINEALFNKGIDLGYLDSDKDSQSYFIEIIPLDASAESKKFGLTDEKQRLEVLKSMAVVNPQKPEKKDDEGKCKKCSDPITVAQLQKIYDECKDSKILEALAEALNKYRKVFKLDTCARKAHFFAQSIQEAGHSLVPGLQGETFNYFKDVLLDAETGLNAFLSADGQEIAKKYARQTRKGAPISEANQIILANFAYGPQYKTGKGFKNTGNDGWNFRGRGLLQITGRSNYLGIQKQIDAHAADSKVNILTKYDSPSKAISRADGHMTPLEAALTGMADWYKDNMYSAADATGKKPDNDVVDMVINIINRYTNSRKERKDNYQKTKIIFDVDHCLNLGAQPPQKPKEKDKEKPKPNKNSKYDIDKAVAHVDNNALPKSKGKCALYVRQALNAGGINNLSGHATEYYDTDKLVKYGFTKIGTNLNSIQLKKGDIAAFGAVKGHPYGHIAMWNGTQWVSDFKQKSFWVANQYSVEKKYAIYRWNQ